MAQKAVAVLVTLLIIFGIAAFFSFGSPNPGVAVVEIPEPVIPEGPYVKINDTYIPVELATTTAAIKKGLSERELVAADSGMLFVFSKPDIYRFWMPNMRFPLDIIWINEGKVVDIHHNVPNDFDPDKPVFYSPQTPARYVLEVNAGFALTNNINAGDSISFNLVE